MALTMNEIFELITKLKVAGYDSIEVNADGSVKVSSMPKVYFEPDKRAAVPELKPEEIITPLSSLDNMTDEEILYYATPYFDEMLAQKAAHAQKLKEEKE